MPVSGSSATLSVPWDTCTWPYSGYLVLQNPSTTADAQVFTVSSSISVDRTTPAVADAPPPPIKVPGPVVSAPANDPAPKLTLHAPELLRVSPRDRVLRFVVYSTGEGELEAGDALKIQGPEDIDLSAAGTAELILVDAPLDFEPVGVWAGER
jgi:hypothetical protein